MITLDIPAWLIAIGLVLLVSSLITTAISCIIYAYYAVRRYYFERSIRYGEKVTRSEGNLKAIIRQKEQYVEELEKQLVKEKEYGDRMHEDNKLKVTMLMERGAETLELRARYQIASAQILKEHDKGLEQAALAVVALYPEYGSLQHLEAIASEIREMAEILTEE